MTRVGLGRLSRSANELVVLATWRTDDVVACSGLSVGSSRYIFSVQ
ncbi:hypothetical protein HMPREF9564_00696 [Cutibacterium acnes HL053PA1]|nr:hypothetical protein HMPREF0675_3533 [Cutibacterium acnes SK137]EFS38578.1 hypothetical protein HMPREF9574_01048 [Cutibacterium acnes HL074PA1]EFS48547.1 hypothetical protein HMPREF9585_01256 [Cutibacterium acnes HL083PA1]EFS72221.1 hypothetical protein HMPREF9617_00401 [Cutibacterium acnes HL056PA1]EFT18603.1 hypothetical protein HMPREF9564_00696 [Cutibacterium acnes HL053PA1]EFT29692.1 hypothetical protein HMPREF9594_00187 [Cutibacterium acnes HL005PA1]EFT69555.1 hypothetical protein HMP